MSFLKNREVYLNGFILFLLIFIIFSYLFPLWYSFIKSEIFIYVNAWDEETYLTYQGALGAITSPGYQISSIITLIFQELNISGAVQNLIFDTFVIIFIIFFIYKSLIIYITSKIDRLSFSFLIIFSSVLFNYANPLIKYMFEREINIFMIGYEGYLSVLRTPEPQLSYLFIALFIYLFFKTKKILFLFIPLLLTYFYVSIVYFYCLILYFFISKLKLNMTTILLGNIFSYIVISIGLIIMDVFFLQKSEIINFSAYVISNQIVFPVIFFVNILYSFIIYLIYYNTREDNQKILFLMSLISLLIIFFVSNFQLLTGYMLSYKNYFDYGLSIIIGIATAIFFKSLSNIIGRVVYIFPLICILFLSLHSNSFDFNKMKYAIFSGYNISNQDKESILNNSESSIILNLDLNSKISYSKAKTLIPIFSYQYTFPFINSQCNNFKELHHLAYEQYKANFPNHIENINYLEQRYNTYSNIIYERVKNMEENKNHKSYCEKFSIVTNFKFIEILPESQHFRNEEK